VAYSELYFTDCLWPDFGAEQIDAAISSFRERERRFGGRLPDDLAPRAANG
jgi:undecaprenyl diphosphate synthase